MVNMVDKQEIGEKESKSNFKVSGWGYRHQQCFILFCTLTVAYSMRACMGVSLVAMTKYGKTAANVSAALNPEEDENQFKPEGILNALMLIPPYPTFNWDKKTQDAVIASFFWGYMLLQIPGGQLAHRFGARYLLTGAMMINCVVSILLPLAAYYGGWISTAVCRVLQGLSQACIVPGIHTSLGKWAPLQERGRIAAFVYGGQALGTVFGLPMTGFISSSSLGWPGIFRFYGILSGIIGVLLFWLAADTPAQHKKISAAERKYIEDELGTGDEAKKMAVPWTKILSHKGVYAIIIAHFGTTWGQLVLYSEVPAYLDKIMGVNIKANGLLTALPFLVMWFTNFFFSWMTDMLIVKNILSPTNTRKFANSLGNVPAALGLIALAYAPKDMLIVESILVFTCAFKISAHLGFQINHIDISPNFAGTMMSLSNFTSNIGASIAPLIIGFILTDVNDVYLWRQVFFVAAGIYLVTNLIYVIFATAEKAEWNEPKDTQVNDEEGQPMMEKPKLEEA
ncbi:putative inorganic phosphate cotransporter [Spodoptera frugiperda]|uniref:Putative inorganic phosphate cotransporter n=1 Tax=Spodoptera frugiperda TaxID=7108 RepID=A0A9R0EJS5_SPOFR|nr:putative inorganic phosphate cotransporter [Spodoptera frugiperda]